MFDGECLTCDLLDRCRNVSEILDYHGVFDCSFCGFTTTQIGAHTMVEYDGSSFEAMVKCQKCENSTERFPFEGREQEGIDLFIDHKLCKCYPNVYPRLWNANGKANGSHEKPYIILLDCRACKPRDVLKCLDSIIEHRIH
jgi:hypothetical protein